MNEEGELNEAEGSEDINETLTEPKPQSTMDPEQKKLADEAIKDNEKEMDEFLNKLDKMSLEEIMKTDPEDIFKGMNLKPVQKPAETKNEG